MIFSVSKVHFKLEDFFFYLSSHIVYIYLETVGLVPVNKWYRFMTRQLESHWAQTYNPEIKSLMLYLYYTYNYHIWSLLTLVDHRNVNTNVHDLWDV